ncbi:hypothetical protein N0V82_007981 [Gnomoniopsis sp. IMI 355080]|nr:hypothetical protein N0V82_007981 [Gnomoniopsis sp. IMI 355080]
MRTSGDSTLVTESLAKKLLKLFCEEIPKQYIIIDGLDECRPAERQGLLDILTVIVKNCDGKSNLGKPRLLIVSQKLGDIEKSLGEANTMEFTRGDNREDIENFVIQRSDELKAKFDLELELNRQINEFTLEYAHGLYLIDVLFVPKVWLLTSDRYNRILKRIRGHGQNNKKWELTRRLLGWLVAAKRSLKMYELQAIICMNLEQSTMEYDEKKLRNHITDCCGALVQLVGDSRIELYLTFDCFGTGISEEKLTKDIKDGYLSFQDYAVSRWFHHLQTMIEKCGEFLDETTAGRILEDLLRALDDFMTRYLDDIHLDEEEDKHWIDQAGTDCRNFKDPDLKDYLVPLWAHVYKQQQNPDAKKREKIGIQELCYAVERNRKLMEQIAVKKESLERHQAFYGRKHFKCERLSCPYFHEGFENNKDRDKHTRRHDRPFQCVIETCDQSTFGFASNKQLEKHMRSYHPETCDPATRPVEFALLNQLRIEGTRFVCTICGKNFTRKINLKGHMDSHNGNKPHECPECGKAFTRKNDMVRHQKIHSKYHGT